MSSARNGSDFTLQALAAVAQEAASLAIAVELRLPGGSITGTVIGRDQWVAEISSRLGRQGSLERTVAAGLERAFVRSDLERDLQEAVIYEYLHLRAPAADGEPVLWRVRIADVAGWSLASTSAAPGESRRGTGLS